MSEVSIAKPISGPEALESCLSELRKTLSKDDRFTNHMAYAGFIARIEFKFYPQLSFIPPVEREIEIKEGETESTEESPTVSETVEIPLRSPNQVRKDADLPQPILVTDAKGQSHEEWKKVADKPPAVKVLGKNVVKGN